MKRIILISSFLFLTSIVWGQQICPLNGKPVEPAEVKSLKSFQKIAILDQGRIKPLDTYAQNLLLQFSGKRTFDRKPAVHWLARFLFAPELTIDDKIFLINNPEIATALGIKPDEKRRYSFNDLETGFNKLEELSTSAQSIEQKERSAVEEEIIRVHQNVLSFTELSRVFKFAAPHEDFMVNDPKTLEILGLPAGSTFSFVDIALRAEPLKSITDSARSKNSAQWNAQEKEVIRLVTNLYHWSLFYKNLPFHIVPSLRSDEEAWLSPWDLIGTDFKADIARKETISLRNMFVSYWNGDQLQFDMAVKSFNESVKNRVEGRPKRGIQMIPLEIYYNKANLFLWAKIGYGLAFLLTLLALSLNNVNLQRAGYMWVLAGFIPHTFALFMRIIILGRPPVSNLYETFIFVGFVCALVGLLIERIDKRGLGVIVASVCGMVFLLIASKFSAEGDTLKMLVAVLNSNFWLGTHVLSITTGYAGVCAAGVIGHLYIIQNITRPHDKKLLDQTYRFLVGTLGFGLTMTFLGTNLGGIWADQSWGRFWGWDPKENGALMIILWTAIVFHAKIGKMIDTLGVAVGSVLGIMVVMWAWFGVNLLSVGLHSYGFTSGVAAGLALYVILQSLFLAVSVPIAKKKLKSH